MKLPKDLTRTLLAVGVVGTFCAMLLLRRPAEELVPISPFVAVVLQFFYRKAGPSGGA